MMHPRTRNPSRKRRGLTLSSSGPFQDRDTPGEKRPALAVLQEDQHALFRESENPRYSDGRYLRDGFETLRDVIHWYQRASVRSFGYLAKEWPAEALRTDDVLVGALVTGEERITLVDDPLDEDTAAVYRRRLEAELVLPACNTAYNELRGGAGEYIDQSTSRDKGSSPDPDEQKHLAMRPTFAHIDHVQDRTLRELWDGFSDEDALSDWLHGLNQATNGAVDRDLAAQTLRDDIALDHLLDEHEDALLSRRYREHFAIEFLLPAFNAGISELSAGELAASTDTSDGYVPPG